MTILPSAAGFPIGARSPDGNRLARLAEVEQYPHAGLTFQFPNTELAREDSERKLRGVVQSVEWDSREAALHVRGIDANLNPETGARWQMSFRLEDR